MGRAYLLQGETDSSTVEEVMARLCRGEMDALSDLAAVATGPIRSTVLGAFQSRGIWVDQDRLHDIVQDSLLELVKLAPAWRADGGAKPWRWARPKLVAAAYRSLGHFTDDIDNHVGLVDEKSGLLTDDEEQIEILGRLAAEHEEVAILFDALGTVASERDRKVWLAVQVETASGNGAPAVTVAQDFGLTPQNVRKIRQRVQGKLLSLAGSESRFAGLFSLEPLAA